MPGSNSGSPSCCRRPAVNSLANALGFVTYLIILLVGFAVGIAVGMRAISFLIQVGETNGFDSGLNLVFGAL